MARYRIKLPERACVLDPYKACNDCGECSRCDLDPNKICDNCMRCLGEQDYATVYIDEIIIDERQH